MFAFSELRIPLVAAPMAGGPSTPELVAAVAEVGGTGFLAAGYKTPEALREQIERLRATTPVFGVNLFVPGTQQDRAEEVAAYRAELSGEAERYAVTLPGTDPSDRDRFEEKLDLLEREPVPIVSFTFGPPSAEVVRRLHEVGTHVVATVTTVDEAARAERDGADTLTVQGSDAGGHRASFHVDTPDDGVSTLDLLTRVRKTTDLPLVAAGGITDGSGIAEALRAGAVAVQLGTAYLRCPESGASQPHKDALADPRFTETRVTRAFSGRNARGLRNRFIDEHDATAPAAYPEVNQLTKPLRAAAVAQADQDGLALWAGTGYRAASAEPAARITTRLWEEAGSPVPGEFTRH
ncbi:NAD(P)H-dependent flavin oxidoreductase [Actinopolyspora mortivallis]|uniref:Probable nitronate monooxygenase n=1 Tax=Actinopolyspora mortivallis TaxID=33906 RepID=A0A2T0H065_ACTMO|nr:nitronate monooxygenase [Actinopolyspora mortivallis]PRW64737.1 2-nitropropane dioxygenase [Actinopolyspora mortivallis]